jgi:hypothetical protein
MGLAIIQHLSLSENRESHESHRNKDVFRVTLCDDLLASQLYQSHPVLSLRLTLMCVANNTCWIAELS